MILSTVYGWEYWLHYEEHLHDVVIVCWGRTRLPIMNGTQWWQKWLLWLPYHNAWLWANDPFRADVHFQHCTIPCVKAFNKTWTLCLSSEPLGLGQCMSPKDLFKLSAPFNLLTRLYCGGAQRRLESDTLFSFSSSSCISQYHIFLTEICMQLFDSLFLNESMLGPHGNELFLINAKFRTQKAKELGECLWHSKYQDRWESAGVD